MSLAAYVRRGESHASDRRLARSGARERAGSAARGGASRGSLTPTALPRARRARAIGWTRRLIGLALDARRRRSARRRRCVGSGAPPGAAPSLSWRGRGRGPPAERSPWALGVAADPRRARLDGPSSSSRSVARRSPPQPVAAGWRDARAGVRPRVRSPRLCSWLSPSLRAVDLPSSSARGRLWRRLTVPPPAARGLAGARGAAGGTCRVSSRRRRGRAGRRLRDVPTRESAGRAAGRPRGRPGLPSRRARRQAVTAAGTSTTPSATTRAASLSTCSAVASTGDDGRFTVGVSLAPTPHPRGLVAASSTPTALVTASRRRRRGRCAEPLRRDRRRSLRGQPLDGSSSSR